MASTEYNKRVSECKQSLKIINKVCNSIYSNLSQVKEIDLSLSKNKLGQTLYKRASYILNENQRVMKSANFLENNKLKEFGQLMFESHLGLKNDYQVSCKELDFLVEKAKENDGILGARMMGGGFGGCTINLIKESSINKFIEAIKEEYFSKFALVLKPIIANPDIGIRMKII